MSETNELGNGNVNDAAIDNTNSQDAAQGQEGNDDAALNNSQDGAADAGADAGDDAGNNAADDAGADGAQDKGNADDAGVYGAPEVYDYKEVKLPKGYEYDKAMLKEFDALNKETNLSQAQANKYMEFGIKLAKMQEANASNIMKQVQQARIMQFQQALNVDKEIGGGDRTKMGAYLDVADKGYTAFANDEVKSALADVGLNYHPAIIKMFHRIGELVGDDKIYASKTPSGTPVDAADILYGSKEN